jgi:predicted YcjX-like family ATPase
VSIQDMARGLWPARRVIRIGITGLARAGKTALLTSLAANLLASGAGLPALPAVSARLGRRRFRAAIAPSGAQSMPRFDYTGHLAALAADPPRWPARTDAVSLLALDLDLGGQGLAASLPDQRIRLELLDYPGEWLLDLPLLGRSFEAWSTDTLRRLEPLPAARAFLAFARGLPANAPADDALAAAGHDLYRGLLRALREREGLALLQPGRFLMPAPGPQPPWMAFFPHAGGGPLAGLLRDRHGEYVRAVARDLAAPSFGRVDRLVVLADVLSALHAGPAAFADTAAALAAVAEALRWRRPPAFFPDWLGRLLPIGGIARVAFAASKSDHVAGRQRGNLAALTAVLTRAPGDAAATASFAIAAVRCTEDFVWTLEGRPVSAVRGRTLPDAHAARSYPGEVPDQPPGADFWAHPFLSLPDFEPMRLALGGRAGVPHINLDTLLCFLLEDLL